MAAEFAQTDIPAPGIMAVDREQRVNFDRMRAFKLDRVRRTLDGHDLGALLVFVDAPLTRITTRHVPLPSGDALEDATIPTVPRIVETVQKVVS